MMAETSMAKASGGSPAVSEDRLSSLPDALLHTIMSFLTARQAVQLCVLSRRWMGLWCFMPCLEIDHREFKYEESDWEKGPLWCPRETKGSGRFVEFVHGLLIFHRAPLLDTFRFYTTRWYFPQIIDSWLIRGFKCCPVVMEICFSIDESPRYELPHLGSSSCRLKRLHLAGIDLHKTFTLHLRSGCPVLEDLVLERCFVAYPEIFSSTLKTLVIIDSQTYVGNTLTVTAPVLVSLHLDIIAVGWCWNGVLVNELPSLVKASFCFKYHPCSGRSAEKGPWKLLWSLINVRDLQLSGEDTLLVLHEGSDSFPTFSDLRTLQLDECELNGNFPMLDCFLNNAPSLSKLTLQNCQLPKGSKKRIRTKAAKSRSRKCQDTTAFQCPGLKSTEIKYKADDADQLFSLLSGPWRNLQKSTIKLTRD